MSEQNAIAYRDARVAQSSQDYGNPASYVEYSTAMTSVASGRYGAAFMRDRVALQAPGRKPTNNALHRTITSGIDGAHPPLSTNTAWIANSGLYDRIRLYTDVVIRGVTGLTDQPAITFRPYLRQGGTTGVVAAADPVTFAQPRLADVDSIQFARTSDTGANYTVYSSTIRDNSTATAAELIGLDGNSSCWFLWGGPAPFCGAAVNMSPSAFNASATSALTMKYWDGTTWTALANVVNGAASSNIVFRTNGQVTWDIPADWAAASLTSLTVSAYWVQGSVTTALTSVAGQTGIKVQEMDLLLPIKAAVDLQADGDDVLLFLEAQPNPIAGTASISTNSTIRYSWR